VEFLDGNPIGLFTGVFFGETHQLRIIHLELCDAAIRAKRKSRIGEYSRLRQILDARKVDANLGWEFTLIG